MTDEEWDKYAGEISGRIQLQEQKRTYEYSQRLIQIQKAQDSDVEHLGDSHGVRSRYNIMREELEEEFKLKRQIDTEKGQVYWDQLSAGKYERETVDKEREQNIQSATRFVKSITESKQPLTNAMKKTLQSEYGDDILEMVELQLKKEQNQVLEKREQERITAQKQQDKEKSASLSQRTALKKQKHLENGQDITLEQDWVQ